MITTQKLTISALFCAVALILSYIESLIPPIIPIPGIKIGLANIVAVFLLYRFGFKYALTVSLLRVFISSLLFGSILTLAYSLSGAFLSLILMLIFKKLDFFSEIGVSIIGGISHNAAQILVAMLVMGTSQIAYYLPPLIVSGVITGAAIGIGGGLLIKKLKIG